MSVRGAVLVTGTEVLTGLVSDVNGPWLSEQMRDRGVEIGQTVIVGDRAADLESALRFLAGTGAGLIVTTGGLGPTADDLTLPVVADVAGIEMRLDAPLEERIWERVRTRVADDPALEAGARAGTRKQAMVPVAARVLEPVGTAPGVVLEWGEVVVVVLPGPPRELRPMWADAVATPEVRRLLEGAERLDRSTLRIYGLPESELAATLARIEAGGLPIGALEITTCQRRGELEIVTTVRPGQEELYAGLVAGLRDSHGERLFSANGSSVDSQVVELLSGRTIATAESCTGGLLAARLTALPGSSAYVLGGVVAYANEVKTELAGIDPDLIERFGAVSPQVARALADGARSRTGADVGVGITGIAGPAGGSESKPVGTVCVSVSDAEGRAIDVRTVMPGGRDEVRDRTTTLALHAVRRLLEGHGDVPGR